MARKTIAEVLKGNSVLMARMTLTTQRHLDGDFEDGEYIKEYRRKNKAKIKAREQAKRAKRKQLNTDESWLKIKKKTV